MSASAAVVVYVHGLWMNGAEGVLLRRRLERRYGFKVYPFSYPSVAFGMAEIVPRLHDFVRKLDARTLHFVGHSLGGLVVYRFLECHPHQPPGRVVFLGTPAVTSRAAEQASRVRFIAKLLGRPTAEELASPCERRWAVDRDLGIIAGSQRIGLGQFLARFDEDCDGTIAVSETRLPGATDHITLPVSHMGMLVSDRVAQETGAFLRTGHFSTSLR